MAIRMLLVGVLIASQVIRAGSGAELLYQLGPDDLILIRATDMEEFPAEPIRIEGNGEINLPLVGRIEAGGMTLRQLEAEIEGRLEKYLQDPDVTVAITEFRSQPISVLGAVARPGVLQVRGPKTLWEILSDAGGFRNDSGDTIKIIRNLEQGAIPLPGAHIDPTGKFSVVDMDINSVRSMANPGENIAIMPNDVISVSQADIVYVVGDVARSGGFVTNGSISVLEALSMAGGFGPRASPGKSRILRAQADTGTRAQVPIDLKKLMRGESEDLRLKPNDILFVPHSTTKDVALGALQAATSIATSVLIFRVGYGR